MTNKSIRVGTIGLPLDKKKLFPHVDVIERNESHLIPPKPATARRWRDEAPGPLVFTAQLSKYLFEAPEAASPLPGDRAAYGKFALSNENQNLWKRNLSFAQAIHAQTLVLLTPAAFTPSKPNREALSAFLKNVSREEATIVWEHHGPWEHEQAVEFAAELDLILAVDPLRDAPPPGDVAYFRLGPFAAMGSRVGIYDLERMAETAAQFETTSVVFGTPRALDDVRNFKKVLAGEID